MLRRSFLKAAALVGAGGTVPGTSFLRVRNAASSPPSADGDDRTYWIETATRIARPVLTNLAEGRLRARMPVERRPESTQERADFANLEAFGRTMAGIAPWLELGADSTEEGQLREELTELSHRALAEGLNPDSADYFRVDAGNQILVDAAFLAHAALRAPNAFWHTLAPRTRTRFMDFLEQTRQYKPYYSNWLLFSAMVEAALLRMGRTPDPVRLDFALKKHAEWYLGDGHYGDGPEFHWDYYNSYVIQPFLLDVIRTLRDDRVQADAWDAGEYEAMMDRQIKISQRYGEIQERLIAPDGSFPPIGRSITYRFGAFQLLAQLAAQSLLPDSLPPNQVRSALTAVIRRVMEAPGTFDDDGWLRLGLYGSQPSLAESYITTGSLYLCSTVFLPLGLPADHSFWKAPATPWTAQRAWSGEDLEADHALRL